MKFDVGIDIGTTNTKIYFKNKTDVLNIPSVIAIKKNNGKIIGIGEKAYMMLGKAPDSIMVKKTVEKGVVRDIQLNRIMLKEILSKIFKKTFRKSKICLCYHSFMTNFEKYTFKNSILNPNHNEIFLIDESLASAIGEKINLVEDTCFLVVNVGGGTTDISIISNNGVLYNKSLQIGGELIDEIIKKNILINHKLLIGKATSEKIKKKAATMFSLNDKLKFKIKGKDAYKKQPKILELSQKEICKNIDIPVNKIIDNIIDIIKTVEPDIIYNIQKNGIILTGGCSLIPGFKELIEKKTGFLVKKAKEPIGCAALGALHSYEYLNDNFLEYIFPA